MPTLSLCMIVKNEERFLEQCLNSVKGLVDEIIVVDTGSTDNTKQIAQKFTDKIFNFEWCDDFSAARNESLKHATGDWILVLDADETIAERDHQRIKEILEHTKKTSISLIHRNYINYSNAAGWISSKTDIYSESKIASGWYPESIIRLFKNNQNILFKGVVHESILNSLTEPDKLFKLGIPIHHYGKLNEKKLKQKDIFYEKLGEKKAIEENEFYAFYELGRQYLHNGKLNEAEDFFLKSIESKRDYFESWFMLGSTYLLKNELDNALSKLRKAQSLNKDYSPIYANLGVIFAKKKEFNKAVKNLIKAVTLNPNDASSYKNLGMCYDEMGNKQNAYYCFKKAVELNPTYKNLIYLN